MNTNQPEHRQTTAAGSALRIVHFSGTLWFILCVGFILVTALRQAGFNWWLIFSLSGHSALVVFLLVSVYLFALYRGVNQGGNNETEHPLTCTDYYMLFYVAAPLLGGVAGIFGTIGMVSWVQYAHGTALGTFFTTFIIWVILDPTLATLETMLPGPRQHRIRRLAQQRAMREERQRRRDQLLSEISERQETDRLRWQEALQPSASELADLLETDAKSYQEAQMRAAEIGVEAWRMGGINCMRRLHEMALESYNQKTGINAVDYITYWWDGIGPWRSPLT